jgi:hypothetical protein
MERSNNRYSRSWHVYHTREYNLNVSRLEPAPDGILTQKRLGPLLGYKGYLAKEAIFSNHEHEVVWKSDRRYADFSFTNRDYKEDCDYNLAYSNKGYAYPRSESRLGCYSGYVRPGHNTIQPLTNKAISSSTDPVMHLRPHRVGSAPRRTLREFRTGFETGSRM